ncbi:LysR family transcriptional regulator [Herbiconiux solani]|uniref:LysR family transcriptional regulator n=1 Tax=Herbiconiux solani TaxID=661329 RepID=UPI000824B918|nr:LysR family transcriptional regulator [Herbiconiux solani]
MDIDQLKHFLAVVDEGHWSRAANAAHVSKATVQASVAALEAERGERLVVPDADDSGELSLTEAGLAFRSEARARVQSAPPAVPKAGGKAKASKGRGRAPVVKGEPKPFKKRQGR